MLLEKEDERDQRRLDKVNADKGYDDPRCALPTSATAHLANSVLSSKLESQVRKLQERLGESTRPSTSTRTQSDLNEQQDKIAQLNQEIVEIQQRMDNRHQDDAGDGQGERHQPSHRRMANESERDFLIRTGKITPFAKVSGRSERLGTNLRDAMLDAEESEGDADEDTAQQPPADEPLSHQHLRRPGFRDEATSAETSAADRSEGSRSKRRRLTDGEGARFGARTSRDDAAGSEYQDSSSPESGEASDAESPPSPGARKRKLVPKARGTGTATGGSADRGHEGLDDGNEKAYQARLAEWTQGRRSAREKARAEDPSRSAVEEEEDDDDDGADDEWLMPHPTKPDTELERGLKIPGDVFASLFDYQKTGVQWLWELHQQQVGGIIGDEMGLGKTIQVISFLASLHHSNLLHKPVLVVAPATVMKQWVNEFHRWWPALRVCILHASGSGMTNGRAGGRVDRDGEDDDDDDEGDDGRAPARVGRARTKAAKIVKTVMDKGHVLVTTYAGLQSYGDLLIPREWGYAVLDEGHKIRNPNTAITIYCKEIRTANRVILSGTPMQNNLTELWSLFDFVFPMRLGTLLTFRTQFEVPIRVGGYANATNLEIRTAINCAETLKDAISPYLLQRLKVDVAADLPRKSEQVLFCRLTPPQRASYEKFLKSAEFKLIMEGAMRTFSGIEKLRKICNHPDLIDRETLAAMPDYDYGDPEKSGKLLVTASLIKLWNQQGHKTLLFAQQRIMLDIIDKVMRRTPHVNYLRMDGTTPIERRQRLVDEFNNSSTLNVFLLTTKVGGLGVNLTGANRVIIFDPDWNPSTDSQARERAWRLGQTREVTIYRLMSAGTIEEKIYHRQLFKQFLANKILKDPNSRQAVPMNDLNDLFTLGSDTGGESETGRLFKGSETRFSDADDTRKATSSHADDGTGTRSDRDERGRIQDITGVAKVESFGEPVEGESQPVGDDSRILDGILAGSGVSSTLKHDEIVNGKLVVQADRNEIEKEARRIAANAARELQRAERIARDVPIGTPTWTGTAGVAGRPERPYGRGRGGPSSASVLAGLQARQPHTTTTPARNSTRPSPQDLMTQIRDYLRSHGGEVRSQMLVDHFGRMCQTAQQTSEFKEMLREIATLERAGPMRGKWVLKREYRR